MIRNKIPAKSRSKYYRTNTAASNIIGGGSSVSGGGAATGSGSGIPYTVDIDGNYIVGQPTYFPAVGVGEDLISSERVITWDQAVTFAHEHANKAYLDSINQPLSTSSAVEFAGVHNRGVLNMYNNNVWAVSNIDFNAYEVDGVVYWNTISNQGHLGFGFNNQIHVGGNIELNHPTMRDIFSHNYGLNVVYYAENWTSPAKITLDHRGVTMNTLSVTGTFNCYELVANKVRSTNGYLYVTDSANVSYLTPDKAVIEFKEYNLKTGDFLLCQSFTGASVTKKLIKLTYQAPTAGNENQFNYYVVTDTGSLVHPYDANTALLPVEGEYYVKIDSSDVTRRTGILLSPYDGSYIDFYTGAGDGVNKTIVTSIGNLDHLGITGVTGYGLRSTNAYIIGDIHARNLTVEKKITGDMIDASTIKTQYFEALDADSNKMMSLNERGDGAACWFVGGKLTFEIVVTADEVRQVYYNADGSIKWYIGSSGTPVKETVDMWRKVSLTKYTNMSEIANTNNLAGYVYREFHSGSVSGNQNYNGLTGDRYTSDSTSPSSVVANQSWIPNGNYTPVGLATLDFVAPGALPGEEGWCPDGYTAYRRLIYTYTNGYITSSGVHRFYIRNTIIT